MDTNRITVRYAKALVELAVEKNVLSQVEVNMQLIFNSLNQFPNFDNYISNPSIDSYKKYNKVIELFGNNLNQLTNNFLKLVFKHKREKYLKEICRNTLGYIRKHNNVVLAQVEMAVEPSSGLIDSLKEKFEKKLAKKLVLTTHVNPGLIGGFVFSIEGQQYDASIANHLKLISKELQQNK
jgi:F-type H+-transporting ATPase subunit delta